MKAIVWTAYGSPDVLQLREVPKPVPKANELLIRIHAAGVTAGDCEMRGLSLAPYLSLPIRAYAGFVRPGRIKILGQELAGEVVATGNAVTRFRVGDPVLAATGFSFGAYAEYICLSAEGAESVVGIKPANLSFEEAAVLPVAGLEALHFMRAADFRNGQRLLINGAGGSIGTYALQMAKHLAVDVTAVDHTTKLEMLRELGADRIIDYTREDFTLNGQTYDAILDVVGKQPYRRYLPSLKPNGRLLLANPGLSSLLRGGQFEGPDGKWIYSSAAGRDSKDLETLKTMVEAGHLRPVIDRRFPLEQAAEAHRYVETGLKKGNVVLVVVDPPPA